MRNHASNSRSRYKENYTDAPGKAGFFFALKQPKSFAFQAEERQKNKPPDTEARLGNFLCKAPPNAESRK